MALAAAAQAQDSTVACQSAVTGCSTAAAGATMAFACRRRVRCASRCCTSSTLREKTLALARGWVWWRGLLSAPNLWSPCTPARPSATVRPAVPPAGPYAQRRVYQPALLRAAVARSGNDFLQAHSDLLTGWSRPSRLSPPRLQLVTWSRRCSATWGCLTCSPRTATRRACTRRWVRRSMMPPHHSTTHKVERVNGVVAVVLHSFAGELADD